MPPSILGDREGEFVVRSAPANIEADSDPSEVGEAKLGGWERIRPPASCVRREAGSLARVPGARALVGR